MDPSRAIMEYSAVSSRKLHPLSALNHLQCDRKEPRLTARSENLGDQVPRGGSKRNYRGLKKPELNTQAWRMRDVWFGEFSIRWPFAASRDNPDILLQFANFPRNFPASRHPRWILKSSISSGCRTPSIIAGCRKTLQIFSETFISNFNLSRRKVYIAECIGTSFRNMYSDWTVRNHISTFVDSGNWNFVTRFFEREKWGKRIGVDLCPQNFSPFLAVWSNTFTKPSRGNS